MARCRTCRSRIRRINVIFLTAATSLWPSDVASLQGADFLKVQLWVRGTPYLKPTSAWHNMAPMTSFRQLQALHRFQTTLLLHPELQQMPLTSALLRSLELQSSTARVAWLPQTFFRELTNLDGAFATLGKYSLNSDFPLRLSESTVWRSAKTAWSRLATHSQPTQQVAATLDDIHQAIRANEDPEMRIYLMLLWLSCGRKGDVAKLMAAGVTLQRDGRLAFFIQEGKGVLARKGKYTVVSHCPPAWRAELETFLHSKPNGRRLFRPSLEKSGEAVQALRLANPALSCRAVRRGALQTIARSSDVSEETLMRMSGHKNVNTLHRYLDWNAVNEKAHLAAQAAARNLTAELPIA